jgi:hypothetical protein
MHQRQLLLVKDLKLEPTTIAWLAGLFEGEANFGLDKRSSIRYIKSSSPPAPYIQLSMIDEDVIKKVSKLVQKNYKQLNRKTSTNKNVFKVSIGDRATLRYLLPLIFPYFGFRRQNQVQECLNVLKDWEIWYLNGGRSQMAQFGPQAKKLDKF